MARPAWLARLARRPWLLPSCLTLAITLFQVDRAQLWRDELATWSAATRPVPDLVRLVGNVDAVSGPYYLLMHAWIRMAGDSVIGLRLPSVLAMTAAAGLTAVLGARLFGPRTGVIAGLLFAVVPSTSRYGQEARSYALVTLLAVGATLLLVRALERPRWSRWAGYGAAIAGLGLAHLVAVTLVAGHAVAVALARRRGEPHPMRWLMSCAAAGAGLVPLVVLGRGQQADQLDWVSPPGLAAVAGLPGGLTQAAAVGGVVAGLAAVGAASTGRWGVALAACLLLPPAVLLVAGTAMPVWVPRYLVFTVPFGCVLAAAAVAAVRPRAWVAGLAVVALAAVLGVPAQAGLRTTHEWPRSAPVDYRAAVRLITSHDRRGDGIVFSPRDGGGKFLDTALAYYARGDRPRDVLVRRDPVRRAGLWAEECDRPERCLAGTARVWLLVAGERGDPLRALPGPKAAALSHGFRVERTWRVPGLSVAVLSRTP